MTELIKIVYSEHAKQQLNERNISCLSVEKTLLEPQQILKAKNDRKIAHRLFHINGQNFLLRVIYEDFDSKLEVVTAYLTTKIDKYWSIP